MIAALPSILSPSDRTASLAKWLATRRDEIASRLLSSKALLFRGFRLEGGFDGVAEALFEQRLDYTYRSTPRTEVGRALYTATEYPKGESIPQHCENAYQRDWPMKVLFHCIEPARDGGRTPLADVTKVTDSIPHEIKDEFRRKQVMYVRNYRAGVDLPWEEVFGTSDRGQVEAFCRAHDMGLQWTEDGLRTRQVCQAFATHPVTGDTVWFNQAHLFHVSALAPEVEAILRTLYGDDGLPRNAYFGDGTPIGAEALASVRAAFERHTTSFPWQRGDVLLVDNMLVSHGREPFEGERRVVVCMAEPHSQTKRGTAGR